MIKPEPKFIDLRKRHERFRGVIIFCMAVMIIFMLSMWAALGYISYEAITAVNDAGWEGTKEAIISGGREVKEILDAINNK